VSRYDLASLRAAWWTLRAIRTARGNLRRPDFGADRIPLPPPVSANAGHAVRGVLARRHDSCLVRALVLQRWHAAHGERRDLVIGVTPPRQGFRAHAWIDGDPTCHEAGFIELLRRSGP
jgi:hypothetical protein